MKIVALCDTFLCYKGKLEYSTLKEQANKSGIISVTAGRQWVLNFVNFKSAWKLFTTPKAISHKGYTIKRLIRHSTDQIVQNQYMVLVFGRSNKYCNKKSKNCTVTLQRDVECCCCRIIDYAEKYMLLINFENKVLNTKYRQSLVEYRL